MENNKNLFGEKNIAPVQKLSNSPGFSHHSENLKNDIDLDYPLLHQKYKLNPFLLPYINTFGQLSVLMPFNTMEIGKEFYMNEMPPRRIMYQKTQYKYIFFMAYNIFQILFNEIASIHEIETIAQIKINIFPLDIKSFEKSQIQLVSTKKNDLGFYTFFSDIDEQDFKSSFLSGTFFLMRFWLHTF